MNSKPDLVRLFRAKSGQILAALIAQCRDIQLAEDALQEAFLTAHTQWNDTIQHPEAWILAVARRRMIDRLRQSSRQSDQQTRSTVLSSLNPEQSKPETNHEIPDERLKLIFTCCHPALNQQSQVALTLKTLCGLSSREIARAYLISETAMNQRLVRAKKKIRSAGIAYKVPTGNALTQRLDSVLTTLYLIYNESYSAFEGQTLTRDDLAEEAIRLARVLAKLLNEPEADGLLALMLLHQSRSPARSSDKHKFIALEHQNRTLWDHNKASEGRTILMTALGKGQPGKYQLQAAISALHSEAQSWQETDWKQIIILYLRLYDTAPSPIVKLNGLVALSNSGREQEALEQLRALEQPLKNYQSYYAAKADIEARLALLDNAKESYAHAIELSKNDAEREFLISQRNKLER